MHVSLRSISIMFAATPSLLGALGMLICFLFLWSSDMRDITGAGLGFVAGAVMLGAGCVALTICSFIPQSKAQHSDA